MPEKQDNSVMLGGDNREIDQRLILAAPDMLDALMAIEKVVGRMPAPVGSDNVQAAYTKVVMAIRKATGKQPR